MSEPVNIKRIREDALKEWDKKKKDDEQAEYDLYVKKVEYILRTEYPDQIKTSGDLWLWVSNEHATPEFNRTFVKYCENQGYRVATDTRTTKTLFQLYETNPIPEKAPVSSSGGAPPTSPYDSTAHVS